MPQHTSDIESVISAAIALAEGNRSKAMDWFRTEPLQPFGGKTAEMLVAEGRAMDVIRLIESYSAGATG